MSKTAIHIRRAVQGDFEQIWPIFHEVVAQGDTYAFAPDTSREEAYRVWMEQPAATYVAETSDGTIVGTAFIKPNQPGLGNHVCNAGFMVGANQRGQGIGRMLGEYVVQEAARMGFRAMQFNMVVSTNAAGVRLWQQLGFAIVGTLPQAFRHREFGYVDAYIMYRLLDQAGQREEAA
jgi:L-amino acid N-acyltransferase YncA